MKIVIDAAIPWGEYYFSTLGEVTAVDGRALDAAVVRDADVLVVRTVTRVDRALLAGSRVRFVATATSGTDHVDTGYLEEAGIGFAAASGCNARAVAEYVLSSLCALAQQGELDLRGRRAGIIGCGQVGSRVAALLEACGIPCLVNDPPRAGSHPQERDWRDLDAVLEADIVSLHVPLVRDGAHPTAGLADAGFLSRLRDDVVFINTSRGEVVDEGALNDFLRTRPGAAAVLDVWRGEPDIDTALLRRTRLGTPHIAGYSLDAKLRGTRMAFAAVRGFSGAAGTGPDAPALPPAGLDRLRLSGREDGLEAVATAVLAGYDVRSDSASLRQLLEVGEERRGAFFDTLRNHYPVRREFAAFGVELAHCPDTLGRRLEALGFQTIYSDDE